MAVTTGQGWRWLGIWAACAGLALAAQAFAADPQPYRVTIVPTGDADLDGAIAESSLLIGLRERAPVGPFALVTRADADKARFLKILNGLGHYAPRVEVRIAGRASDDPALLTLLEDLPAAPPAPVEINIDPGPLYHLGVVDLQGPVSATARAAFTLQPGDPARAAAVLAAGQSVLDTLLEEGFALATLSEPDAVVDHAARTLDILYLAEPGPRLGLGAVEVIGLDRLREDAVHRRLGLTPGEPFSPSRLETARRDLLAAGALAWARLTPATMPDAQGRLPLRLEVAERPLRALRLGGAYSSDIGGSLTASWTHRNLFGRAEQLTLGAEVGELAANRPDELGYLTTATLRLPDIWRRDLNLRFDLGATREFLDAYDRDAANAAVSLERRFSNEWSGRAGLGFDVSRVTQDGVTRDYRLLSLPASAMYDSTDDPLDPARGIRLTVQLIPTEALEGAGQGFVLGRATGSTYLDLSNLLQSGPQTTNRNGRRILATRLALGSIVGTEADTVPPDWRFYSGGGGSVRGYPFQSIGPETASGQPAGGDGLLETALELRQRFGANWGLAGFLDAGAISANGLPGADSLSVGFGLGLRYYTPIGPVRVDVATPLTQREGIAPVQLYIGIGQAF
ncbi:autotransporter assembly complex protein TamA [Thiocystis violascens]|uniref:Outer membrane protein n=1 Tax=Thiocystis violascens (strain ATCC 17096 / DSM 198 / 6111) TaxID=765911 RepID=I3Y8V1_THIV6|nr:BamA/TamA family outer membrane protein [Thiocystis violascens]AFL73419.1 outer membrane protein [Thiocystis violascens DSM 198]